MKSPVCRLRKSTSRPGGHQGTPVRAAAAGPAGHPGPDPGLQVQQKRFLWSEWGRVSPPPQELKVLNMFPRNKQMMGLGSLFGEGDLLLLDGDPAKERQVVDRQVTALWEIL